MDNARALVSPNSSPHLRTSTIPKPWPLPMLAKPFDEKKVMRNVHSRIVEEKYDGFRILIHNSPEGVTTWSRTGVDSTKRCGPELLRQLSLLPYGLYDGELVMPGGTSYDVAKLENRLKLEVVLFDMLWLQNVGLHVDMTVLPYSKRRKALEEVWVKTSELLTSTAPKLRLAFSWTFSSIKELHELVASVWERYGEGVIIKDTTAPYSPGKRTDAFMKIKDVQSEVVEVVGFCKTEGEVLDRGAYATTVVRTSHDIFTMVKTLDDATLRELETKAPFPVVLEQMRLTSGKKVEVIANHPYRGRQLRVEYHQKTEDGNFRSARWDRWEDE